MHDSLFPSDEDVDQQMRVEALSQAVRYTIACAQAGGATSTAACRNTAVSFYDFLKTGKRPE